MNKKNRLYKKIPITILIITLTIVGSLLLSSNALAETGPLENQETEETPEIKEAPETQEIPETEETLEIPEKPEKPEKPDKPEILKIDVCHATASETNPYTKINVNINSVEDSQNVGGHGKHSGDIWAPYTYGGVNYPGQGDQSIIQNGCEVPNDEPPKQDFAILNLNGRCLGVVQEEVVLLSSATIEWTVSNGNNVPINFSWQANNSESGNGTAPANGSTTFQTSGTGNSVTLTYNLGDDEFKTDLTIEVCEGPKEEPKDEPQDEPRVTVDAQPDQPAGGTGPAVLPILATLLVGGSTIGLASGIILKKKS